MTCGDGLHTDRLFAVAKADRLRLVAVLLFAIDPAAEWRGYKEWGRRVKGG